MQSITWLRPEYEGREDELINLATGAKLVGVTKSAVSNWAKRHPDFPEIALLAGLGPNRTKYVPRDEFLTFARKQLANDSRPHKKHAAKRPAIEIYATQVTHYERQVARLAELEAHQAHTLTRTRSLLRKAKARLQSARESLDTAASTTHHGPRADNQT